MRRTKKVHITIFLTILSYFYCIGQQYNPLPQKQPSILEMIHFLSDDISETPLYLKNAGFNRGIIRDNNSSETYPPCPLPGSHTVLLQDKINNLSSYGIKPILGNDYPILPPTHVETFSIEKVLDGSDSRISKFRNWITSLISRYGIDKISGVFDDVEEWSCNLNDDALSDSKYQDYLSATGQKGKTKYLSQLVENDYDSIGYNQSYDGIAEVFHPTGHQIKKVTIKLMRTGAALPAAGIIVKICKVDANGNPLLSNVIVSDTISPGSVANGTFSELSVTFPSNSLKYYESMLALILDFDDGGNASKYSTSNFYCVKVGAGNPYQPTIVTGDGGKCQYVKLSQSGSFTYYPDDDLWFKFDGGYYGSFSSGDGLPSQTWIDFKTDEIAKIAALYKQALADAANTVVNDVNLGRISGYNNIHSNVFLDYGHFLGRWAKGTSYKYDKTAQVFLPKYSDFRGLSFIVKKVGSPGGSLKISIYDLNSSGFPQNLISSSITILPTDPQLGSNFQIVSKEFPGPVTLQTDKYYAVVFEWVGTHKSTDNQNYYSFGITDAHEVYNLGCVLNLDDNLNWYKYNKPKQDMALNLKFFAAPKYYFYCGLDGTLWGGLNLKENYSCDWQKMSVYNSIDFAVGGINEAGNSFTTSYTHNLLGASSTGIPLITYIWNTRWNPDGNNNNCPEQVYSANVISAQIKQFYQWSTNNIKPKGGFMYAGYDPGGTSSGSLVERTIYDSIGIGAISWVIQNEQNLINIPLPSGLLKSSEQK